MATPAKAERIELTAVSGLRFFATAFMVMGRAIENLWIDEGTDAHFLTTTVCSGLHTGAKDMVSFYFMLSGFTMCWGYLNRDFESDEVRWRYWIRRFVRFYPDFAISSILTYCFKHPYFFGCHDYGWWSAISNASSLLLFSAWYRFIPGSGYRNGPVWFIVTLFWLWIIFPYLLAPVRATFRNSSWSNFLIKFALLWFISLVPWAFITEENINYVRWALRCFPPLRIPEFVMGMALAIRVSQDRREQNEEGGRVSDEKQLKPRHLANVLPLGVTVACLGYYLFKVMTWPSDCSCLPSSFLHCFGWFEVFDTKFSPLHAMMIYAVTTLDVNAVVQGGAGVSKDSVVEKVGLLGSWTWQFLTWGPFVTVGGWGLPIFLYQTSVNTCLQAFLVDVGWGLKSRCETQNFTLGYAWFYWVSHVLGAYVVAWLMNEDGLIGKHIHGWVKTITPKNA